METDPIDQQVTSPTQNTPPDSTDDAYILSQKEFVLVILGVIALLLVVAGGAYYLGLKHASQQQFPTKTIPTITTNSVTPTSALSLTPIITSKCNQPGESFSIQPSKETGWCLLSLPLKDYSVTGYSLNYPENWSVRLAGAEGMNLMFNEGVKTGSDSEVFVQMTSTKLTLDQSDKATYSFEMSGPNPLVDPKETVVSRSILTIGDKQVLDLITKLDGNTVQRYFLQHKENEYSSLYMFKSSGDNKKIEESMKRMISSMTFIK